MTLKYYDKRHTITALYFSFKIIVQSWGEELVDAPSEDELLDGPSEEWVGVPSEEELVFVDTTSAAGRKELGTERDYLQWCLRPATRLDTSSSGLI